VCAFLVRDVRPTERQIYNAMRGDAAPSQAWMVI